MAFHKQHTHGRVFHGLEARHMLEAEKRDSHGNKIKLNLPDNKANFIHNFVGAGLNDVKASLDNKDHFIHNAGKNAGGEGVVTVTSQVFVTQSKTFAGPAVYVTETGTNPPPAPAPVTTSAVPAPAPEPTTSTPNSYESAKAKQHQTQNSYESAKSRQHQGHTHSSAAAAAASTSVNNGVVGGTPLSQSRGPTVAKGTPIAASHSITANQISNQSHGMTSGGKAGLALGILAILGITAGLILFCMRRRKKQLAENGERLDEKHASQNSFFSGTAAAVDAPAGNKRTSASSFTSRTGATAPRLSLRPMTALLPNVLTGNQMSEKPRTAGENPFADAAMLSEKQSSPNNPFADGRPSTPNHSAKPSWESNEAGTPRGAQIGTAAAVAVGAKGPAPPRGPNNVHRVQLDFKPSMDDELELKSGQLVRMLHEYDDGWVSSARMHNNSKTILTILQALCIRMDRSQQGVCPRTCLSKLPVKPRPNGPPPNGPNGRPMGPPPPGMRGPPPPSGNKMMPRPLTPNGRERSNTSSDRTSVSSPQEDARVRSQSVSAADRPVSPIDTGVPARKPVGSPAV